MESVKSRTGSPRERAAKALCLVKGYSEDMMFNGHPVWRSLLADSDSILMAALDPDQWQRIRAMGPTEDDQRD
jgi:hypothetical protein